MDRGMGYSVAIMLSQINAESCTLDKVSIFLASTRSRVQLISIYANAEQFGGKQLYIYQYSRPTNM